MTMKKIATVIVLLIVQLTLVYSKNNCPAAVKLNPCGCYDSGDKLYLKCYNINNVKNVFQNISKQLDDQAKFFEALELYSVTDSELPANATADIKFNLISIGEMPQVKHIDPQAFSGTADTTHGLLLEKISLANNQDIFYLIHALPKLTLVQTLNINLHSIPDSAFKRHPNLHVISITNENIDRVGYNAFRQLGSSLRFLEITDTNITEIADNGFAFDGNSTQNLRLILKSVMFSTETIGKNAFAGGSRPVSLSLLNSKHMSYLNETIYGTFLDQNPSNEVVTHVDCSECHNKWLIKSKFGRQVNGIYCTNDLPLNDPRNFAGC